MPPRIKKDWRKPSIGHFIHKRKGASDMHVLARKSMCRTRKGKPGEGEDCGMGVLVHPIAARASMGGLQPPYESCMTNKQIEYHHHTYEPIHAVHTPMPHYPPSSTAVSALQLARSALHFRFSSPRKDGKRRKTTENMSNFPLLGEISKSGLPGAFHKHGTHIESNCYYRIAEPERV